MRSTFMTDDDAIATTESAEQRIDRATDAIRSMSHDLANEVASSPTCLDRVSAATREAPIQALGHCIPGRDHSGASVRL